MNARPDPRPTGARSIASVLDRLRLGAPEDSVLIAREHLAKAMDALDRSDLEAAEQWRRRAGVAIERAAAKGGR